MWIDAAGNVGVTFSGPDDTDIMEVVLAPETARDLAFNLTKASFTVEGDDCDD